MSHLPQTSPAIYSAYELQEPSSTFYTADNRPTLKARLDRLDGQVREELKRQGFEDARVHTERMLNMRFEGTDTAACIERFSTLKVTYVPGEEQNFKITYPHDVALADELIRRRNTQLTADR